MGGLWDYTGCNIDTKTLLAMRGKLPLKFTCLPLLNKGELQSKDTAQNVTCRAASGARLGLVLLARLPFFAKFTSTYNGASGYIASCYIVIGISRYRS